GDVGQTLRCRPALCRGEHLGRDVGQCDVTPRGPARDRETWFTGASGDIEVLLVLLDLQRVDHRLAHVADRVVDDVVPLLPTGGELPPHRPLSGPDLLSARHRAPPHVVRNRGYDLVAHRAQRTK